MHLFYTPDINDSGVYTLNEEESKHCIRVLRLSAGSEIILIDGRGGWYKATITDDNVKRCTVTITETEKNVGERSTHLHIAIAPTKSIDRIEWFVEKAVEIGIDEISLIETRNTERVAVKTERLKKVAVSAMKQSIKAYLPQINELTDFEKFVRSTEKFEGQKFIAHCSASVVNVKKQHLKNNYSSGRDVLILIGPEGDFAPDEVKMALDKGFLEISLGNSRLRTETAALYTCTMVNVMNE